MTDYSRNGGQHIPRTGANADYMNTWVGVANRAVLRRIKHSDYIRDDLQNGEYVYNTGMRAACLPRIFKYCRG